MTAASTDRAADALFERVEGLVDPKSGGRFSAAEPAAAAVIRAVAKPFGLKPGTDIADIPGETLADSVERIGREADLVMREVAVEPGWRERFALPFVVERADGGAPVAVLRKFGTWRYVDGAAPRSPRPLTPEVEASFSRRGWVAAPSLPNRDLKKRDVFKYGLRTKLPELAAFALLTIIAGSSLVLLPLAANVVIDMVVPGRDMALLGHVCAMLAALIAATMIGKGAAALTELRVEGRTAIMLRSAATDRMIRLKRGAAGGPSAATATLVTRAMEGWHRAMWKLLLQVAGAFLLAAPSLVMMTKSAPMAALFCFLAMTLAVGYSAWNGWRQIEELFAGAQSPTSWVTVSYETLAQIETVRAGGAEGRKFQLFAESFLALKERFLAADRVGARLHALESALESLILGVGVAAAVLFYASMPSQQGVAFATSLLVVTGAAVAIVQAFQQAAMIGLMQRLVAPLLLAPSPPPGGATPPRLEGAVSAIDVTVRDAAKTYAILDSVTLDIPAGRRVAIVGHTGAGKTTLLRALMGLEPLDGGSVRYDGIDLSRMDRAALRRQIGVVGQAARLFPGTLRENIEVGRNLEEAEIEEAVRMAAFEQDLASMPLGLSTPIGDAQSVLSAGQTQRVLLARAFAGRPRVLFLDEATSALDPACETRVSRAIDGLDATVVMVAHRLDTVRGCDWIVVLDQGKVVESGTYDDLAAAGGAFAALVAAEGRSIGAPRANPVGQQLADLRDRLSRPSVEPA